VLTKKLALVDGTSPERFQCGRHSELFYSELVHETAKLYNIIYRKPPVYRTRQKVNPHDIVKGHTWDLHK